GEIPLVARTPACPRARYPPAGRHGLFGTRPRALDVRPRACTAPGRAGPDSRAGPDARGGPACIGMGRIPADVPPARGELLHRVHRAGAFRNHRTVPDAGPGGAVPGRALVETHRPAHGDRDPAAHAVLDPAAGPRRTAGAEPCQ